MKALNGALNLQLRLNDIEQAFVHEVDDVNGDTPTLQIMLFNIKTKKEILRNKGALKPTKIFVKEHLTPRQSAIFYQARIAKRNGLIHNCWTGDGLVYGCHTAKSPGVRISNLELIVKHNEEFLEAKNKC